MNVHIEILVEDSSGQKLLEALVPKVLGAHGEPHNWRLHAYRGVGRVPKGMQQADPSKRMLLDQLPRLLRGYGQTQGIDAVVVVLDTDKRDCRKFLAELTALANKCKPVPRTLFRLAIEEVEAWYFGDQAALLAAYPRAKKDVLAKYVQDSPCDTWERLADAIHTGGSSAIKRAGWPLPGQMKHKWAAGIGPLMDPASNTSPSFKKFRDGLRALAGFEH